MNITRITITPIQPHNGQVAFASLVLDDQLFIGGIAVHEKRDGSGYRLTYPLKQGGSRQFSIFHPVCRKLGARVENAIIMKLKDVMRDVSVGHSDFNAEQA